MPVQMAPSILSADFARLADEAAAVTGVAEWLHVDVMDNHFVPNLTLGLPVVEALLKHAGLPLDCHLMIEDPDRWAPGYAEAGARNVTIHAEAVTSPVRTLRMIRAAGARAGLAVNPVTPVEPYEDLLPEFDMLLLMTVEPGPGAAQAAPGPRPGQPARRRGVAPGGRRGQRAHHRAVRRSGRGRLRRGFRGVQRGRPGQGRAGAPGPGRAGHRQRRLVPLSQAAARPCHAVFMLAGHAWPSSGLSILGRAVRRVR
jgi:ribulose-phosphate 3-epimerase